MSKKWYKVTCPKCGYEIRYQPTSDWDGELKCPDCGNVVKVYRLDDFSMHHY